MDNTIVRCLDCRQASRLSEWGRRWNGHNTDCPNPGCWPGMNEFSAARRSWEAERDAYVKAPRSYAISPSAFREMFERQHPAPKPSDFEREPLEPPYET